jgi:hypothetical protein
MTLLPCHAISPLSYATTPLSASDAWLFHYATALSLADADFRHAIRLIPLLSPLAIPASAIERFAISLKRRHDSCRHYAAER